MTRKEYLAKLETAPVRDEAVGCVEAAYGCTLPPAARRMVSFSRESVFFDDGFRTLSLSEVLDAQADLQVDFRALGLVPLADCGDNDFIVCHVRDGGWSKFNIADELVFKKRPRLEDLLA